MEWGVDNGVGRGVGREREGGISSLDEMPVLKKKGLWVKR